MGNYNTEDSWERRGCYWVLEKKFLIKGERNKFSKTWIA